MKCYENHISAYLKVELFHDKQCGVLSQCVKILKIISGLDCIVVMTRQLHKYC